MIKRIVLVTYGSLGDLHPFLAVALGLQGRGHDVVLATSQNYRARVEEEGIAFQPVPPDLGLLEDDPQAIRRSMDLRTGTEFVVRSLFLPYLEQSYESLLAVCDGTDLIVGHPLAFAVPIVAQKLGIRWLSVGLQPMGFLSCYDPPVLPIAPWLAQLRFLGPLPYAVLFRLLEGVADGWLAPIENLRRRAGLPKSERHPLMHPFSPHGTLAWFSRVLAEPQPDWPPRTQVTGFPFYDRAEPGQSGLDAGLAQFLDAGEPPVVFTLGSAAVWVAGNFYQESAAAAEALQLRAVLLVGRNPKIDFPDLASSRIHVGEYAPYSELFGRSLAVVHQGGIGTTAQVLRAGRPMVVVPFSHDQPDNAERARRLGVARVIARRSYEGKRVARTLGELVQDQSAFKKATAVASRIQSEDGVAGACNAIEALL